MQFNRLHFASVLGDGSPPVHENDDPLNYFHFQEVDKVTEREITRMRHYLWVTTENSET